MTVNSSNTRELSINQIVYSAIRAASLLPAGAPQSGPQWEALARDARNFLEIEIDNLAAVGVIARAQEFYEITLVAGTSTYDMPSDTVDVTGDAMYIPPSAMSGEIPVHMITREHYQLISDKETAGVPTSYFPELHSTVKIYLWPVPDANSAGTLRVKRQKLLADNDDGSKTVDLQRHWSKYLIYMVAHYMALSSGMPPNIVGMLNNLASKAKPESIAKSAQPGARQMMLTHRTGWNR